MSEHAVDPATNDTESVQDFDLHGDLPWGRLSIEASAGTGKTYTLCHLAARYIAEAGIPASAFLVVTFTRAATAELRSRIRTQILERLAGLSSGQIEVPPGGVPVEEQITNLRTAITEYDTITITTIHGFATQTLRSLGAASQMHPPQTFSDEDDETISAMCSDAIMDLVANGVDVSLLPKLKDVTALVRSARSVPDMEIQPADPGDEPTRSHVMATVVESALLRLAQRRSMLGSVSFNDVLTGLRDALDRTDSVAVVEALRNRYRVVMIDEFQDTDPIQWTIFGHLFAQDDPAGTPGRSALILVGDPKQSIYSFRGADISTYTRAITSPGMQRRVLGTNWRSDGQLLDALETLLTGTTYGEGIAFTPVKTSPERRERHALDDGRPIVPIRLQLVLGEDLPRNERGNAITAAPAQDALWADVVARVQHSLRSVEVPTADGGHRPLEPSDIAILVRKGPDALLIQEKLIEAGVPAVLSRAGRVLDSPAAEQWRWLIDALVRPSDPARVRRFAISWFGGLDPGDLDSIDEATMADLFERLRSWLEELRTTGVTTFVQKVIDVSGVIPRLLMRSDGDRCVTDVLHVGEILATLDERGTPTASSLLEVIRKRDDRGSGDEADEFARRVETQDSSVQIMTIWVSKGLEFPIVMVPTLFTDFRDDPDVVVEEDGHRVLDVTGTVEKDLVSPERKAASLDRHNEEMLRLAYVALTRSSHQVTAWWATTNFAPKSPLSRILFARTEDGVIDPVEYTRNGAPAQGKKNGKKGVTVPKDSSGIEKLRPLLDMSGGLIEAHVVGVHGPIRTWGPAPGRTRERGQEQPPLEAASLDPTPDRSANRWSFTRLTSFGTVDPGSETSEHDDSGADDEHHGTTGIDANAGPEKAAASMDAGASGPGTGTPMPDIGTIIADPEGMPLGWLPAGTSFGTLVHKVYEKIDFTDPQVETSIQQVAEDQLAWRSVDLTPSGVRASGPQRGLELLSAGIRRTLETPLGSMFDDRTLKSIDTTDRLSELSFDFHLDRPGTAGHEGGRVVTDRDVGALMTRWFDDDPLRDWAIRFTEGRTGTRLAGHMNGEIDAVFRVGAPDRIRYIVCDYKTNRLDGRGDMPDPRSYTRERITDAMAEHDYPLQALIYSVALHRFLRSRLPDYDPSVHLGGVAYLFVRGMIGSQTPVIDGDTTGVWSWTPPTGLILELSDLFAGPGRSSTNSPHRDGGRS